jgi:hypothetical protein
VDKLEKRLDHLTCSNLAFVCERDRLVGGLGIPAIGVGALPDGEAAAACERGPSPRRGGGL